MIRIKYLYEILTVFLILISLSSIACADSNASGKILKADLIFGPDENLDPAYKYTGWYMQEAGIYDTLFSLDENMNIVPALATSFEQMSDTEYKIHLRPGVKFHDGTPMKADAVVYSLGRVMDSSNSRHGEFSFIDSVKALDDNTVSLKTTKPNSPTISALVDPIVSIVKPGVNVNTTPVGTRPFKFDSYEKGVKLSVMRNDDYWGDKAKLDGAIIYFVTDPMTRAMQLEGGDIDIALGLPQTEVKNLQSKSNLVVKSNMGTRENLLYINTKKAPFDNVLVRQALNHAIDRQEIVDTALEGVGGVAAIGVLPSSNPWSTNEDLKPYEFDTSKAKELLSKADVSDVNGDGWLEFQGKPFEVSILTYTSRAENKPSAEVVAAQLEKIGIKSKVEIVESGAFSSQMTDGNYDLALGSWNTGVTGDADYSLSKHFGSKGSYAKQTGYSNPQVDECLEKARVSFDKNERMDYYKKVQEQVLVDSPEIPLFYLNTLAGVSKNVDGYEIYPASDTTFLTPEMSLTE
jgi:peptide/nickel transport system substrate-binding protein